MIVLPTASPAERCTTSTSSSASSFVSKQINSFNITLSTHVHLAVHYYKPNNMEKQAKKFLKSAKSNWSKAKRTYVCRSLKYVMHTLYFLTYSFQLIMKHKTHNILLFTYQRTYSCLPRLHQSIRRKSTG